MHVVGSILPDFRPVCGTNEDVSILDAVMVDTFTAGADTRVRKLEAEASKSFETIDSAARAASAPRPSTANDGRDDDSAFSAADTRSRRQRDVPATGDTLGILLFRREVESLYKEVCVLRACCACVFAYACA